MRPKRHVVNILLPPQSTDDTGGTQGEPAVIRRGVPCSIDALTASEAEQVNSTWGSATQKVEFYTDPARQVTSIMYLEIVSQGVRLKSDGTKSVRQLSIIGVIDKDEKGMETICFCNEAT